MLNYVITSNILSCDNTRYAARYLKFIAWCISQNNEESITEKHHILPRREFPEYLDFKQNPWNLAKLTPRQHYLAHWMLGKLYASQFCAFGMMRRAHKTGILYEIARPYINKAISDARKNNPYSPSLEQRQAMSDRNKGKVNVRDKTGKILRVSTKDPRYLSGELIYYRVGYKHTDDTKTKMIAARKDMRGYNNGKQTIFLKNSEEPPEGFTSGYSDSYKANMIEVFASLELLWATDKFSGEVVRVPASEFNPDTHFRGRSNNRGSSNAGFLKANAEGTFKLYDVENKRYILSYVPPSGCLIRHGGPRTKFAVVEGRYLISPVDSNFFFPYKDKVIPGPYSTCSPEHNRFRKLHAGKTLSEIGVYLHSIAEYEKSDMSYKNLELTNIEELPSDVRSRTFGSVHNTNY